MIPDHQTTKLSIPPIRSSNSMNITCQWKVRGIFKANPLYFNSYAALYFKVSRMNISSDSSCSNAFVDVKDHFNVTRVRICREVMRFRIPAVEILISYSNEGSVYGTGFDMELQPTNGEKMPRNSYIFSLTIFNVGTTE